MARREKTRFVGVYVEESTVKRHAGKPDKVFYVTYKKEGKLIWEKAGWASEGMTAAVANNLRTERVNQIRTGEEIPQERKARLAASITLDEFFEQHYYPWLKKQTRAPKSTDSYYRGYISPKLGRVKIAEIKDHHFNTLKRELEVTEGNGKARGDGLAPATVKIILGFFKTIITRAHEWNMIPTNPLLAVTAKIKVQNARTEYFRHEQIDAIINRLNNPKEGRDYGAVDPLLKECVLTALKTGLRANEVASIRWGDIDWNNGRIRVVGKNGEIDYVFPPPSIFAMLDTRKGAPGELVFPAPRAGGVRNNFENFASLCNDLGFNDHITDPRQKLTFHSLRHTYASWLVIAGMSLYDVSKLMRHKSIKMTERYAKLAPNYMNKALEIMDRYQPVIGAEVEALPAPHSEQVMIQQICPTCKRLF